MHWGFRAVKSSLKKVVFLPFLYSVVSFFLLKMKKKLKLPLGFCFFYLCVILVTASDSLLSPKGVNFEGLALQDLIPKYISFFFFLNLFYDWWWNMLLVFFVLCGSVAALMSVKKEMKDELLVMGGWDINSVDPCTWNMVGCSAEGYVISL